MPAAIQPSETKIEPAIISRRIPKVSINTPATGTGQVSNSTKMEKISAIFE